METKDIVNLLLRELPKHYAAHKIEDEIYKALESGCNIDIKELSLEERNKWSWDNWGITCEMESVLDEQEVPTKLITITYNDKTIESYE